MWDNNPIITFFMLEFSDMNFAMLIEMYSLNFISITLQTYKDFAFPGGLSKCP